MQNSPVGMSIRLVAASLRTASAMRGYWNRWRERSINHRVFAASLLLALLAVVCKLVVAGRELATAYWFGTGDAVDAFVVASMFPSLVTVVVGQAAGSALLPAFARVRQHEGDEAARRLLRESTFWCMILLTAASVLLAASARRLLVWICPGFDDAKQLETVRLLWLLLPAVILHGVAALWSVVLHTRERFAATGIIPALTPAVTVAVLLLGADRWHIRALAVGFVAGSAAELAVMAWALKRCGYRLLPRVGRLSPELRQVARQYVPLTAAAAMTTGTVAIDNAMASWLGSGNVATLNYGRKLVGVFLGIGTLSLGRAVFPYFSQMVTAHDWTAVRHTLRTYRRLVLLGTVPLTVLLIFVARPLVAVVLERGRFDAHSTEAVSCVQIMYALQIPFYTLSLLYFRLVSSLRLNQLLMLITVVGIVLNVALNLALMPYLGVAGIALSTSFVYVVTCVLLATMVRSLLEQRGSDVPLDRPSVANPVRALGEGLS